MAASGVDVVSGDVEVHEDIDEMLSETVRKYSVLYDKTLKTVVVVRRRRPSSSSVVVVRRRRPSSVVAVLVVIVIINKFTLKYLHISLASP